MIQREFSQSTFFNTEPLNEQYLVGGFNNLELKAEYHPILKLGINTFVCIVTSDSFVAMLCKKCLVYNRMSVMMGMMRAV